MTAMVITCLGLRAYVIQLIANIPFPRSKMTIWQIHISSGILIIITSTKITEQILKMQLHTKHKLLTDTNKRVPFVIPVL
jgi:hypothetical protein